MNENNNEMVGLDEIFTVLEGGDVGQRNIDGLPVSPEVLRADCLQHDEHYGFDYIENWDGYWLKIVDGKILLV